MTSHDDNIGAPLDRPLGPWDTPAAEAAGAYQAPPPVAAAPRSPANEIIWALISTALLAVWFGWTMGWIWALAGVVGILVHEVGHLLVINALGFGPSRIRIIPFLGGAATMARAPDTEFKGVLIALSGPVFGLIAALPFFGMAAWTGDLRWTGGAFFIAVINLINLAPAPPLDGSKALGPALYRIHPLVERGALVLVGIGAVYWAVTTGNWIFGAFVGIATLGAFRTGVVRTGGRPLGAAEWLASVALWLIALALCLAVIVTAANFGLIGGHAR